MRVTEDYYLGRLYRSRVRIAKKGGMKHPNIPIFVWTLCTFFLGQKQFTYPQVHRICIDILRIRLKLF